MYKKIVVDSCQKVKSFEYTSVVRVNPLGFIRGVQFPRIGIRVDVLGKTVHAIV